MNKELFGIYDDRSTFDRLAPSTTFDRILEGPSMTVGIADPALERPGRSFTFDGEHGLCVLWGEAYLPAAAQDEPGRWLLDEYAARGTDVLDDLNGSYLVALDHTAQEGIVSSDILRSRECYYTDELGPRLFGSDPSAVAQRIQAPTLAPEQLVEFFQFGVVLDDRTALEQLQRIPLDCYVTADDAVGLDRLVYQPQSFDYADELAKRLRRALARRANLPGRKGLLLSGGYDSRAVLAGIPDIDVAYTIGNQNGSEVVTARQVASQYGAEHHALVPDDSYLNTDPEVIQYGHGIMESLHIHHAAYTDQMDVDTIFHGSLGDTVLRGHFLPLDGVDLFDHKCPPYQLDPDPDVATHFASKFGFQTACERLLLNGNIEEDSPIEFIRRRVDEIFEEWDDRYETVYDSMALFGFQNQPTRSFRYHLIDHFMESCVAVDSELVEWHLATPPEHRNTQTFLRALRKLDSDILRHRPPDRPYDSFSLNQIDNFVRRKLPLVPSYEGPWPDREQLYEQSGLDSELFDDDPAIVGLPWRLKLRVNDLTSWLESATDQELVTPADVVTAPSKQEPPAIRK